MSPANASCWVTDYNRVADKCASVKSSMIEYVVLQLSTSLGVGGLVFAYTENHNLQVLVPQNMFCVRLINKLPQRETTSFDKPILDKRPTFVLQILSFRQDGTCVGHAGQQVRTEIDPSPRVRKPFNT